MRPRRRETYGRSQPKSTRMPSVDGQVVLPGRASQGSSEVAKADAERRVGLYVLASALLVGGALRVWLAFNDDGISHPDEMHKSLEPAHRLVFGYGLVDWVFVEGGRKWLFPGTIAAHLELY